MTNESAVPAALAMVRQSEIKRFNATYTRIVNRAGLFGLGLGLTFRKTSDLFRARYDACK